MPTVYVNEVNVGINESFFVELHAPANSSFDGLVLVFYIESAGAITSYPISLRNKFSLAGGYFMIGGSGTNAVESETEIRYTSKSIENALREPVTAIAIALFKVSLKLHLLYASYSDDIVATCRPGQSHFTFGKDVMF